jgi:hypothetical protein
MWGMGTAAGAVRVTLFDHKGERYKMPLTLSQIRAQIVARANDQTQASLRARGHPSP